MTATYNGTAGTADEGYSSGVHDLNIFYDVSLSRPAQDFAPTCLYD